jgi:hypothetical protein
MNTMRAMGEDALENPYGRSMMCVTAGTNGCSRAGLFSAMTRVRGRDATRIVQNGEINPQRAYKQDVKICLSCFITAQTVRKMCDGASSEQEKKEQARKCKTGSLALFGDFHITQSYRETVLADTQDASYRSRQQTYLN